MCKATEDIMSVSEREQAMLVHRERRMTIMIAANAASSTKGANHDYQAYKKRMTRKTGGAVMYKVEIRVQEKGSKEKKETFVIER